MHSDRVWWYVFIIAFVATALAESFLPARKHPSSTPRRWISNYALLAVSSLLVLCAFQFSGIALACALKANSIGVMNRFRIPYALRFAIGFAVLDLAAYLSHRAFHAVSPLWRIHQVHHSETDLDLTTGLRFHPAEALFVQGFFLAVIAVLGVPPAAVIFAALAVVIQDFFTHANMLDQSTNFGTIFSLWDRVFRTYSAGLPATSEPARYGLAEISNGSELNAAGLLLLPFRREQKVTARNLS